MQAWAALASFLAIVSLSLAKDPFYTKDVFVDTALGKIQGFHVNYGSDKSKLYYGEGDVFLGIPFVQPPVKELRFQMPKQLCALPGSSPYDATFYRPACPQDGMSNDTMSEDCLYLNVFSPTTDRDSPKAPVMIWIHGGSMRSGTARDFGYKGAIRNLVSRGVVVVTIQYRIGLLGFFTTHSTDFPPNLGMLDQVEAIRWVKDNIANFGGDPHKITLFGQSAGGASVSAHSYSPLSQHLFQGAIMESGVTLTCFEGSLGYTDLSFRRANAVCNITRDEWKSNNFAKMKNCLMNADYHTWLPLERNYQDAVGWKMSQDNYFIPDVPANLAAKRPNIPVMLGSMQNEWSAFDYSFLEGGFPLTYYTKAGFELEFQTFAGFMGSEQNHVMKIMENVYLPPGTGDNDNLAWLQTNDKALTCAGFTGFIGQEADNFLINKNPNVYLYSMVYSPNVGKSSVVVPNWSPVGHSAELPYVWATEHAWNKSISKQETTTVDYAVLDWFGESWTNFAKYGFPRRDPTEWTPLSTRGLLNYYEINGLDNKMKHNYRKTDQTIWNQIVPVLAGPLPPVKPDYNNGTNIFLAIREKYEKLTSCDTTSTTTSAPSTTSTPIQSSSSSSSSSSTQRSTVTHNVATTGAPGNQTKPDISTTTTPNELTTKFSAAITIWMAYFVAGLLQY